jgi:hypothetical protein
MNVTYNILIPEYLNLVFTKTDNILKYCQDNGLTAIPTKFKDKAPFNNISRDYIEKNYEIQNAGSYHEPLQVRKDLCSQFWKMKDELTYYKTFGVGIDLNPGWNEKSTLMIDIDINDEDINEKDFDIIQKINNAFPTFVCRGARGAKFILFFEGRDEPIKDVWTNGEKKHIEIKGAMKQYCVIAGAHPKGMQYTGNINNPIKTVNFDNFKSIIGDILTGAGYTKTKQDIIEHKVREKYTIKANNDIKKLIKINSIEQAIGATNAIRAGAGFNCTHPVHGSSSNARNLSYDPSRDIWHCWACDSAGGILEWLAIKEGICRCEDFIGGYPLYGDTFKQLIKTLIRRGYFSYEDYGAYLQDVYRGKK